MESIGRYRILSELGRGGGGVVYLGIDPSLERKVAIKTLQFSDDKGSSSGANSPERLMREARAAALLGHPNIVTVFELSQHEDIHYIAMEYVPGRSLGQVVRGGEIIAPGRLLAILRQVAAALDFAHSQGVIHRDVKPSNIMIPDNAPVKLADFGIAKLVQERTMTNLTQAGAIMGTMQYMSPEQVKVQHIDGRSDQFSLAVIAFEILTGRRPVEADSSAGLLYKIAHGPKPSILEVAPHYGQSVENVFQRVFEKDRELRYGNCAEFVEALSVAISQPLPPTETVFIAPSSPLARPASAPGKRSLWPFAALPLVAALAGGLVWWKVSAPPVVPPPTQQVASVATSPTKAPDPAPIENPPESFTVREKPKPVVSKPASTPAAAKPPDPAPAPAQPAPVAVQPAPQLAPPPEPAVEAGKYRGPPTGRFTWSGSLASQAALTISAGRATSGSIAGKGLPPGTAVSVEATPSDLEIAQQPSEANGFKLILRNRGSDAVSSIVIRWREVSQ